MKHISKSPEETKIIAENFIRSLKTQDEAVIIALEGDLGAGKTTFSQYVGEFLGVRDPIQSPTFLIEKIYELRKQSWQHLVHIDAYRLDREQELLHLGWTEIIAKPENLVLVEWADKIKGILPDSAYRIVLTHISDGDQQNHREIEIKEPPRTP